MGLRAFFLGRDGFKSAQQIMDIVRQSKYFTPNSEDIKSADALIIFQTSKQQTWFVVTGARMYCVLDDLSKGFTRVQWALGAAELIGNGKVKVNISTSPLQGSKLSGLLDVDGYTGWLFSKKLFTDSGLEDQVRGLIVRHMLA